MKPNMLRDESRLSY
ncbi:hypothetical protein LINPERHAP2_LOCUS4512 [Linum perenne]